MTNSPRKEILADGVELWLGDCREVLSGLPKVDAVVTDPPYPQEFEPLYEAMAEESSHLLPVGGSLIALCGHYQVPRLTQTMGKHLRFWWLCGMRHTSLVRLPGKWVCTSWKPALWFVNQRRHAGDTRCPLDMMEGGGKDKEYHEWGQPVQWFTHWIEALSTRDQIILDPFCGSGTTGVAAVKIGRRFIGCEINPDHFSTACRRIDAALRQPDLFIEKPKPPKQEVMPL